MSMNPRLLRPTASGFNPRSIAGLEAWWDSSDASSVTRTGSPERVAQLDDKSGNGRHATNTTAGSTQPLYILGGHGGRNVIRFSNADNTVLSVPNSKTFFEFLHNGTKSIVAFAGQFGTSSADQNVAMFALSTYDTGVGKGFIFAYDDRAASSRNNAISTVAGSTSQTASTLQNDAILPGQATVVVIQLDIGNATAGERIAASVNGAANIKTNTLSGSPPTGESFFDFGIGRRAASTGFGVTGDFYEALIYSQIPSSSAAVAISQYLIRKWL